MKIHIYSKTKEGAWGGGNQFLKALRIGLIQEGAYSECIHEADAVIFNGYQDIWRLVGYWFSAKRNKKIVYRLGPILHLHRGVKWKIVDYAVVCVARFFADLVIFQSLWSYEWALKLGLPKNKKYCIILNAVDDSLFFRKDTKSILSQDKIQLIYSSWSSNMNKGFSYLAFLDTHLDFEKYEMTFVGNTPLSFEHICVVKPLSSKDLSDALRRADIFISPVKDDACSNALLEALACGLPAVALLSGGNKDVIQGGGLLFATTEELLLGIDEVASHLSVYQDKIPKRTLRDASLEYIRAIKSLHTTH